MEALVDSLFRQLANLPPWGQFLATALATAMGEEIAALSIWSLARNGTLPWSIACGGVFVGAWTAHAIPWVLGRAVGVRALSWKALRTLREKGTLAQVEHRINRRGWIVLGVSRFLPGIRIAVYLLAGILNVHPVVFLPVLTGITLLWMAGTMGFVQVAATLLESHPIPTLVGTVSLVLGFVWIRRRRARRTAEGVLGKMEADPVA
jgi:membrane protein DedA with SNARE-associated domain